jgi:uncharacterized membrane protein YdbT with pleckstrin-like domain
MIPSPQDRASVLKGILTAWGLSIAFIVTGVWLQTQFAILSFATFGKTAAFSLALSLLPLAAGIGWAARTRHFEQNIDGSAPAPGTPLHLTRRYIENTLEQTLLFFGASCALFFAAPAFSAAVLPIMAIWFCIARALFYFGYNRRPLARAVGFASTFHPTLALIAAAIIMTLRFP